MKAGGLSRLLCVLVPLALAAAGCRTNPRQDLLENELRSRETMYREALAEQRLAEHRIEALSREVEALRQGGPAPSPEQSASVFGVRRIALGRATGGYDKDSLPGDELLQVVIEPRDGEDHTIKAPGTVQVVALEITPQGLKVPIGSWELSSEQLGRTWKQTLFGTGYTLQLPWQKFPHSCQVRVVVRLVLTDGRPYEADRDVKVRPLPLAASHPPAALPMPASADPKAAPLPTLPPPAPLPGAAPGPLVVPSAWTPAPLVGVATMGRPRPTSQAEPAEDVPPPP